MNWDGMEKPPRINTVANKEMLNWGQNYTRTSPRINVVGESSTHVKVPLPESGMLLPQNLPMPYDAIIQGRRSAFHDDLPLTRQIGS